MLHQMLLFNSGRLSALGCAPHLHRMPLFDQRHHRLVHLAPDLLLGGVVQNLGSSKGVQARPSVTIGNGSRFFTVTVLIEDAGNRHHKPPLVPLAPPRMPLLNQCHHRFIQL